MATFRNQGALQILRDHHQQISGLFDLVRNSPDLREKLALFQQLKDELELHSLMEEKTLYPAVSSNDELSELLDRSYDRHDEMSDLVEEIDQMEIESIEGDTFDSAMDEFDDAVEELQMTFMQHLDEEERELFPEISQLLDDNDLLALGNEMNEMRGLGMAA